jgi:hypothetical protein
MLCTVLSVLPVLPHQILTTIQEDENNISLQITNEKTEGPEN